MKRKTVASSLIERFQTADILRTSSMSLKMNKLRFAHLLGYLLNQVERLQTSLELRLIVLFLKAKKHILKPPNLTFLEVKFLQLILGRPTLSMLKTPYLTIAPLTLLNWTSVIQIGLLARRPMKGLLDPFLKTVTNLIFLLPTLEVR